MFKRSDKIRNKIYAIIQLNLLFFSILAFSFIIGESAVVSAQSNTQIPNQASGASATQMWQATSITSGYGIKAGEQVTYRLNPSNGKLQFYSTEKKDWVDSRFSSIREAESAKEIKDPQSLTTPSETASYKSSLTGVTGAGGHLIDGVIWAAGAFGFGYMIAGAFGLKGKNSLAVGSALASGVFTYKIFQALGPSGAGKISETCATWCGVGVETD